MRRPHLPPDRTLDRPGLRWFVSLRRTIVLSLTRRQLCLVRRRHGVLTCRYPGGVVLPLSMSPPSRLEEETAATFFRSYRPRDGDVVVDAGAGSGAETLVLARLVGRRGKVVAIEAHPSPFGDLELLCRLNGLGNVAPVQAALLDAPGTALISDNPRWIENTVVGDDGTLSVPAETLDGVLERLGVERIDFLKMNIEGAELMALEGFAHGLRRTANVAVACHDFMSERVAGREHFRTKAAVRSLLESYGFDVAEGSADDKPWRRDYLYARARSEP